MLLATRLSQYILIGTCWETKPSKYYDTPWWLSAGKWRTRKDIQHQDAHPLQFISTRFNHVLRSKYMIPFTTKSMFLVVTVAAMIAGIWASQREATMLTISATSCAVAFIAGHFRMSLLAAAGLAYITHIVTGIVTDIEYYKEMHRLGYTSHLSLLIFLAFIVLLLFGGPWCAAWWCGREIRRQWARPRRQKN